jgi:Ran GTPase-activating protein (RanGAP) involved in mRNA processing and transport
MEINRSISALQLKSALKDPDLNPLEYFKIEQFNIYLDLKDRLFTQNPSLAFKRTTLYKKYKQIKKELKVEASEEQIQEKMQGKTQQESNISNAHKARARYSLYLPLINVGPESSRKEKNPIAGLVNKKNSSKKMLNKYLNKYQNNEDTKYIVDYLKYSFEDYFKNDSKLLKSLMSKYELTVIDSIIIFSVICDKILHSGKLGEKKIKKNSDDSQIEDKPIILDFNNQKMSYNILSIALSLMNFVNYSKIDLSYTDLEGRYVSFLSMALCKNVDNLTVLNLSNNKLGDIGCKYLFKNLHENEVLKYLNLAGNEISSVGVEYMSDYLNKNDSLITFILQNNIIGPQGAKFLCEPMASNGSIRAFNLSYNGISSEGAKHLQKMFQENKKIVSFNFGGNYLKSIGMRYLAEGLKENKSICYITLEWNNIDDEGAEYLAEIISNNENLTTIDLEKNLISDFGVEIFLSAISEKSKIENINLSNNKITCDGLIKICEILKLNKKIASLDLSKNNLGDQGKSSNKSEIACKAISSFLSTCTTLKKLNLSYINLNKNIMQIFSILKLNKSIYSLNLNGNKIGSLYNSGTNDYFSSVTEFLTKNSTLNELYLDENKLNDLDIIYITEGLCKNKGLKKITLNFNLISNKSVEILESAIKSCKKLNEFEIEGNRLDSVSKHELVKAIGMNRNIQGMKSHFKNKLLGSIIGKVSRGKE